MFAKPNARLPPTPRGSAWPSPTSIRASVWAKRLTICTAAPDNSDRRRPSRSAEGAHVTINGRTLARVDHAIGAIRHDLRIATIDGIAADLSHADGCIAVVDALPSIDTLVNNLGIFEPKPFDEIADDYWMRCFETNVLSGIRLARHYVGGMRTRNWRRIVFVSSESALQIPAEMIHYGMTKTAQLAAARGLAETLRGTGVTVNSGLPGPTTSEGVGGFVAQLAADRGVDVATVEREFFATARPSSVIQRFANLTKWLR